MRPRSRAAVIAVAVFAAGVALRVFFVVAYRPALLGIPDSGIYIAAAHRNLFSDQVHPAGYPLFLRAAHVLSAHLSATTALQHLLGVAAALVLFLVVRRVTGSVLAALVPAVVVLFGGLELFVEHSPLSDALFVLLTALVLLVAVVGLDRPLRWLVLLGLLLGCAVVVRTVALWLLPLLFVWLLVCTPGDRVRRLARAVLPVACAAGIVGGYVAVQRAQTGVTGLTQADGRFVYAVAAQFADCSKFTPPAGTRALCETSRPASRGSMNQYLEGYPDFASSLPPGGRAAVSPAWRVFGPMPHGNSQLAAFGRAAILHQPLDYLHLVARNFSYYWTETTRVFLTDAAKPDPGTEQQVAAYYATGAGVSEHGFSVLRSYADVAEVSGPVMVLLLLASLSALAVRDRWPRAVALLLGSAGWLLLLGAAAVHIDPRYTLPAVGPLAAAAAMGVRDLGPIVIRRLRIGSRWQPADPGSGSRARGYRTAARRADRAT